MGQYFRAVFKPKGKKKWIGYNVDGTTIDNKLMAHCYVDNLFVNVVKKELLDNPCRVVWAGDYADAEPIIREKLYNYAKTTSIRGKSKTELNPYIDRMKYIVNVTKKKYVDYSKVKNEFYGAIIDPLPILCAEGNGKASGDYYGDSMEYVGSWARNLIYITDKIPEGYKELIPDFKVHH